VQPSHIHCCRSAACCGELCCTCRAGVVTYRAVLCCASPQVYEDMVKQLEVSPLALRQAQEALAANPGALLPALAPAGGPIADLPSDQAALVWIQYMRFSRRSESVNASRKVRGAATVVPRQSCSLGRVLCWSMCGVKAGNADSAGPVVCC
jgi:hypothetical protein